MPTLTTQSIGVAGVPLTTGHHAASIAQAAKSSEEGGIQTSQNQARAATSSSKVRDGKKRSVQQEKRAEGTFEHLEEDEHQEDQTGREPDKKRTPYSRIA